MFGFLLGVISLTVLLLMMGEREGGAVRVRRGVGREGRGTAGQRKIVREKREVGSVERGRGAKGGGEGDGRVWLNGEGRDQREAGELWNGERKQRLRREGRRKVKTSKRGNRRKAAKAKKEVGGKEDRKKKQAKQFRKLKLSKKKNNNRKNQKTNMKKENKKAKLNRKIKIKQERKKKKAKLLRKKKLSKKMDNKRKKNKKNFKKKKNEAKLTTNAEDKQFSPENCPIQTMYDLSQKKALTISRQVRLSGGSKITMKMFGMMIIG